MHNKSIMQADGPKKKKKLEVKSQLHLKSIETLGRSNFAFLMGID